jgi:inhibitor of cysteine peptidase
MKKYCYFILMCCLMSNVFAKDNPIYTDSQKPILLTQKSGSSFTIEMPANPTTGYMWFLADNIPAFVHVQSHRYQAPVNKKMIGAAGVDIWTFNVDKEAFKVPQMTTIHFVYTRPWDMTDERKVTFTVLSSDS